MITLHLPMGGLRGRIRMGKFAGGWRTLCGEDLPAGTTRVIRHADNRDKVNCERCKALAKSGQP